MEQYMIGAGVIGFVVIAAVVIYLIAMFGMRERTFEEVIAEQRRREAESKAKKPEKKDKKKYRKGKGKGEKAGSGGEEKSDKSAPQSEEEQESQKMVELELEPEVIDPVEHLKPEKEKKREKKSKKSILINREEKSYIKSGEVQESFHPQSLPKDEVELMHEKLVSQEPTPPPVEVEAVAPPRKEKKRDREAKKELLQQAELIVQEEAVQMEEAIPVRAEPPRPKKKNRSSPDFGSGDVSGGAQLTASVRAATLNDAEIQSLIEILLNKQGATAPTMEWKKSQKGGDPIALLRKQLEDKERALQEEQQMAHGASQKLKELKQELTGERQKYAFLQKQSDDKISTQKAEIEALHTRMVQTHQQHQQEINNLKISMEQMQGMVNDGQVAYVHRLEEENQQLKEVQASAHSQVDVGNLQQQVKIMQDEMARNCAKLSASENAKTNMESKIARYEEQIRKLETGQRDAEMVLDRKFQEVSDELRRAEARNSGMQRDLEGANASKQQMEQEVAKIRNQMKNLTNSQSSNQDEVHTLQAKLQDADKEKDQLNMRVHSIEAEKSALETTNQSKDEELMQLKEENVMLAAELKTNKERTSGEGQEAPAAQKPNGAAEPEPATEDATITVKEHESLLREKAERVSQMENDLQRKQADLDKLTTDLEAQKKKNNEMAGQQKELSAAVGEVARLQSELTTRDSSLQELRDTLQKSASQTQEGDRLTAEVERLQVELSSRDNQVQALVTELQDTNHKLTELQESMTKARNESSNQTEELSGEVKLLQVELANKEKQLQTQAKQLQENITSKDEELHRLTQQLDQTLGEKEREVERVREELTQSLRCKEEEFRQLEQQIEGLAAACKGGEELHKLNEKLKQELALKESQLDKITVEYKEDIKSRVKEVEKLNANLEEASRNKYEETLEAKKALEEKIAMQESKIKELVDRKEVDEKKNTAEMQEKLSNTEYEVDTLSKELEDLRKTNDDLERRVGEVTGESDRRAEDLTSQLAQLTSQLTDKDSNLLSLTSQLQALHKQHSELQAQSSANQDPEELNKLRDDLNGKLSMLHQTQDELEVLRRENHELREKNWAAMEALNVAEKKVANGSPAPSASPDQDEEKYKQVLQRIFPAVSVKPDTEQSEWLSVFEKQASQYLSSLSSSSDLESQIEEAKQNHSKLQSQVQHYKAVLADTEGILNQLQSSVECEEHKWQQRVHALEEESNKTKEELTRLKEQQSQQEDNSKLSEKIKTLEDQLSSTETERESLRSQLTENLEDVKKKLEEEQQSKKALASANVKLNGMLRVGQDAIKAEQDLVKQLQDQLSVKNKGLANGTSSSSDVVELKTKLAQTQKQLERELHANKQLTQRLAASAASSGKDGTSV